MNEQQKNLCKLLIRKIFVHEHECYPGYKSEFVMTYTEDEKQAMQEILKDEDI